MRLPNRSVLLLTPFAQAEKVNLLPLLPALDLNRRFLLARIARRRGTDHLFPVTLRLEVVPPRVPLRLPARHQVVVPVRPNLGQIFFIRHAAIDHHRRAGFPPHTLLQGI